MADKKWMIYGATGYTGQLIAERAKALGLTPTLAGRSPDKVQALAERLGLPGTSFSVDDPQAVRAALAGVDAVLSVAGPFSATAQQMISACIDTGTHYLDVTGEIAVFEYAASRSADAEQADVALIPGVGFDVVPSDCLAAHTAKRIKAPARLRLAIAALGGISQGTAKTAVESLGAGTFSRKDGKLVAGKPKTRMFDIGRGAKPFVTVSWGDVATAYYSTGIKDIEVYFPFAGPVKQSVTLGRFLGPILKLRSVKNFLKRQIEKGAPGPTAAERAAESSVLLAEVEDAAGNCVRSTLTTPNGYSLTAESAVAATLKLLDRKGTCTGYHTPSTAFGADFVLGLEGCSLKDL